MNNGFFDKAGDKAVLYPDGSNEGVQHEDAGNPLGWMPKKLRSMVQVVDPAVTSEQDQYKMMEEVCTAPSQQSCSNLWKTMQNCTCLFMVLDVAVCSHW